MPGVKYFSGAATYSKTFEVPSSLLSKDQRLFLDLGKVQVMADVKLNGQSLGILWKPPFRVEVTDALKPGDNKLEIKIVNLWVNRQIGDESAAGRQRASPRQHAQTMAPMAAGRQTQPRWPLHLHHLAALEQGFAPPGVRPARPGQNPQHEADFARDLSKLKQ